MPKLKFATKSPKGRSPRNKSPRRNFFTKRSQRPTVRETQNAIEKRNIENIISTSIPSLYSSNRVLSNQSVVNTGVLGLDILATNSKYNELLKAAVASGLGALIVDEHNPLIRSIWRNNINRNMINYPTNNFLKTINAKISEIIYLDNPIPHISDPILLSMRQFKYYFNTDYLDDIINNAALLPLKLLQYIKLPFEVRKEFVLHLSSITLENFPSQEENMSPEEKFLDTLLLVQGIIHDLSQVLIPQPHIDITDLSIAIKYQKFINLLISYFNQLITKLLQIN